MHESFIPKIVLIIIAIILAAGGAGAYFILKEKAENGQIACTEEAKVCPDGSAVGRVGPNCEFAPCPDINAVVDTSDWQIYRNEEYEFEVRYPQNWKLDKYVDGYNNEGPYVLVFTIGRTQIERYPFISIRENWSANKEIDRINSLSEFTKVKNIKDISIGLILARQIIYSTDIGLDFQKTIVTKDKTVFMFDSYPNDNNLNKILSTFKFID